MNQLDLKGWHAVITGIAAGLGLGHHAAFLASVTWRDRDTEAQAVFDFSGGRATY